MFDWKSQFGQQRRDYLVRTAERLAAMEQILAVMAQHPQDLNPLRELSQHFHQLAGSSAIYEMDQLGDKAAEGEKNCNMILRNQELTKPDWKNLKDMVESMRFLLSQHPDMQQSGADNTPAPNINWTGGHPVPPWAANAAQHTAPLPKYEKPKDILIVDGDQGNMMSMTRALEEAGMQTRGFRTTDGAKKAIHDRLPDALLLNLPLMDGPGYDVAQELRSVPDGLNPPILIHSRQFGFLDKVMAIRSGADAFFNELSEPATIVKKLQSLFERDKPNNYTILSVEDDPDQATFIRGILESVGYNVHSISDPRQFEEALLAVKPDLLLLDVMLGPMSGFELARYVRSDDRYATVPIIFLTTQNQLNAHVESARVGGDEHLIKPVAPQLLVAAVSGRLERYRVVKKLIGRDGLTGFLTLSTFMEQAEKMPARLYSGNGSIVMLVLDVDFIENINDTYSYAAGDKVISSLAKLLKRNLRNAELFARLGADDFAVIVEGVDDRELAEIATQIIKEFENIIHEVNGQTFRATVSAGAAALETDMDLKTWLANAQLALKSAKSGGRNRVMKAKTRASKY